MSEFLFKCNQCRYEQLIPDYLPRVYVLEDGRTVDMPQRHVWCTVCRRVTPAESLDWSPQEIETQTDVAKTLKRTASHDEAKKMERDNQFAREAFQEWKARRRNAANCLVCSNHSIALPASEMCSILHAECGGTLCLTSSFCSASSRTWIEPHRYDTEGTLIQQGILHLDAGPGRGMKDQPLPLWYD